MSSGNDNNDFPPGEGASGAPAESDAPLNTGRPAVAAAPGKLLFVILFAGIFVFIIVRSLMSGDKEPPKEETKPHKERVTADTSNHGDTSSAIGGGLPTAPDITTAQPPLPPPSLPAPPPLQPPGGNIAPLGLNQSAPMNEALAKRIHSPMFVVGGAGAVAKLAAAKRKSAIAAGNDPNGAFADSIADSKAEDAVATKVENLNTTIIQGKLIHAVLESAIDSTLPGPLRAIVSHDIYAEAGREILIPKGSRLIGVYNAQIKHGQARVFVIWQRVIRPDGVDIFINSPGVDLLGRAGNVGDLDNHYFEEYTTALLTSALDIGTAAVGDALFGNQQTTTTNNGTGSTTTLSPTAEAMQSAVQNIGQLGSSIVSSALALQPVIYLDQGTPIDVFVNRDLMFPREVTGAGGGFIN